MQLNKLFTDYVQERLQVNVLQNEHAFYLWKFIEEDTVYITDMYVAPAERRSGVAGALFVELLGQMRELGVKRLVGSTDVTAANPELGMYAMLSVGFKPTGASENIIWYSKEIA